MVLIRIVHRVRRFVFSLFGVHTHGARAIAFDETGRLLLVRARYGNRARWQFPGGGVDRGEAPADAAVRETREEAGCALTDVEAVGVFERRDRGWRDTVHLFRGRATGEPRPDGFEIAEVGFFALDDLPPITKATRRRLDELAGKRQASGRW